MPSSRTPLVYTYMLAALAAACSSKSSDTSVNKAPPAVQEQEAPPPASWVTKPGWTQRQQKWRTSLTNAIPSRGGCFQVSYPSTDWVEVPCETAPDIPLSPKGGGGETVGNGTGDNLSQAPSIISWAEGSFPSVSGVTSVTDSSKGANAYSLQLNTNQIDYSGQFGPSPCSTAPAQFLKSCRGWEQFVYRTDGAHGALYIEYWLINYGPTCPSGWNGPKALAPDGGPGDGGPSNNCVLDTKMIPVNIPITSLGSVALMGRAGARDAVILSTSAFTPSIYVKIDDNSDAGSSVLSLNRYWNNAEFNVFGYGGFSQAAFNPGVTLVLQTLTDSQTPTTSSPTCGSGSFTGETNNLTVLNPSCCPVGGDTPGIQFSESNVAFAPAQACPPASPTSIAAVCGRGSNGIDCAAADGMGGFASTTFNAPGFSDSNQWGTGQQYYSTIQFADIDGDGNVDVCGRGANGIDCSIASGQGFAGYSLWDADFGDSNGPNGWNAGPQYYSTIHFADVDGDGRADVCGRNAKGINCALSNGTGFSGYSLWASGFSDGMGWNNPAYYSTIRFVDINGDGRADVCGRGSNGIDCATSTGTSFTNYAPWATGFSDPAWSSPQYYSTIRFADIDGDGQVDVCGRGSNGMDCATSNGSSFINYSLWDSNFSDGMGWAAGPQYYSTVQLADIDGDGKADVCGRGSNGIDCSTSTGSGFTGYALWAGGFADNTPWPTGPQYYSTIRFADINNDRMADVCGRGVDGIDCAISNGTTFTKYGSRQKNFNDSVGWNNPQYYSTVQLTDPFGLPN